MDRGRGQRAVVECSGPVCRWEPLQEIDSKEIATTWNATTAVVGQGVSSSYQRSWTIILHSTRAGIPWHIIQRGNHRAACFYTEEDDRYLTKRAQKFGCAGHAYVLMANHVHLLLTPEQAESAAYRALFKALLDKA